eukprot:TRINITY_DN1277_c0_g2_i5.p1 TRINITY_DN1277_c0_g2~~TRINITY_DN1277_c0_g2_i5.p1  ORF type:complete len:403 (-),score=37.31 TRINITY_DN1277_c0_g2_i5:36-1172(-)
MQGKQYVTLGGFILRFLLIIYGNWQDENHEVGFTDVDYKVFTDAAQNILQNQSPYTQPTYRYSPLIALLLTPNIILFQQFGKLIFCCVDLIVGQQIYWYAKKCLSATEKNALIMQSLWVFNVPFVGVISSRGNSDSIAVMLILGMLQLAQRGRVWACGLVFGLAVHLRVFPVIYGPALALKFGALRFFDGKSLRQLVSFVVGSAASFLGLLYLFYSLYGFEFIQQTYLYHLERWDYRHNFSVYFYGTYLQAEEKNVVPFAVSPFSVQIPLILFLSYTYRDYLYLSFILTSIIFVGFNKVITAQYFTWFFGLLPLLYGRTKIGVCVCVWICLQINWLYWGYALEFLGQQVFLQVWLSSLGFFVGNVVLVLVIILTFQMQ